MKIMIDALNKPLPLQEEYWDEQGDGVTYRNAETPLEAWADEC